MLPTALALLMLVQTDPATGKLTVAAQPMSAAECAARLAQVRRDAPRHLVAWCAAPGQAFEFSPEWKGS